MYWFTRKKYFNITGTCHGAVMEMVEHGAHLVIHCPKQSGTTTVLATRRRELDQKQTTCPP
ncbi:MAG: hypothetical protein RMJ87_12460 [Cytophagales bacterium]|nr:hypothetical protein [Bernardetiaceae bacterium]MDW8205833.1 hypothetical protein [Cytophagales bacterium]